MKRMSLGLRGYRYRYRYIHIVKDLVVCKRDHWEESIEEERRQTLKNMIGRGMGVCWKSQWCRLRNNHERCRRKLRERWCQRSLGRKNIKGVIKISKHKEWSSNVFIIIEKCPLTRQHVGYCWLQWEQPSWGLNEKWRNGAKLAVGSGNLTEKKQAGQFLFKDKGDGASLVAQWLRIRLPMQGTRVRALVREDPTCRGATKPVRHNY